MKKDLFQLFLVQVFLLFLLVFTTEAAQAAMGGLAGPEDQLSFDPASNTEGGRCANRAGVDLNELLGVSEAILFSRAGVACLTVSSGEFFIPFAGFWNVNSVDGIPNFPVVYPDDYTPAEAAPIDDIISKVSIKYVVDGRKTYLYPGEDVMKVILNSDFRPGMPPFLSPISVAKLHPLPVGDHTVVVSAILSARHCDGLGTNPTPGVSCLPEGETPIATYSFQVFPGAAQSR